MLDVLDSFRRKSSSSQEIALEFFSKGIEMLEGRMFKQAMIQFQHAIQAHKPSTLEQLEQQLQKALKHLDYDASLAIGLILIKDRPKDWELANTLGNCARHQKNYKQANSLYKHSLKLNRKNKKAFFNLAASMGKVEKYDDEVRLSIEQFANTNDYILPDYQLDPKIIDKLEARITSDHRATIAARINQLETDVAKAELDQSYVQSEALQLEIQELRNSTSIAIQPTQIYQAIEERIHLAKALSSPATQTVLTESMNLVIYALTQHDGERALQQISAINSDIKPEHLEMCKAIALELSGKPEQSIQIFNQLISQDPLNRYLNLNLGVVYRRQGSNLLATKYLAIGANLLERSDGLYKISDLIEIADQSYEKGDLEKALKLYQIVCKEEQTSGPHMKLAEIYLTNEQLDEATIEFRTVLKNEPDNQIAKDRLKEIHDSYFEKAESFFRDNKYNAAAGVFERALSVMRLPETVRKTASVYQVLRKPIKAEALLAEYEQHKSEKKDLQEEKERQSNIVLAKAYLKQQRWSKAIEHFENAFRMKVDKDVFVYLATIYKKLKKIDEMKDLLNRWNRMVEREEKINQFN